ncbi:hypothetical protein CLU79DRAFT_841079 [Phycomyces nitens]|nr:hypothetical protein CLU79DRAFT_841079 [Phycomyces nitens]
MSKDKEHGGFAGMNPFQAYWNNMRQFGYPLHQGANNGVYGQGAGPLWVNRSTTAGVFSGDAYDENVYEFLMALRQMPLFQMAESDETKIKAASIVLVGTAQEWFQEQSWKDVHFEGASTGAQGQMPNETAGAYMADKIRLLRRFQPKTAMAELETIGWIINGLLPQYQGMVAMMPIKELAELQEVIQRLDYQAQLGVSMEQQHSGQMPNGGSMGATVGNYPYSQGWAPGISPAIYAIGAQQDMGHGNPSYHQAYQGQAESQEDRLVKMLTLVIDDRLRHLEPKPRKEPTYGEQPRGCYNCQNPRHIIKNCTAACGNCGQQGHTMNGCRMDAKKGEGHQDFQPGRQAVYTTVEEDTEMQMREVLVAKEAEECVKKQLEKARATKKVKKELDQEAVKLGLPKPSVLEKARKNHPMMIGPDGQVEEYDIVGALKRMELSISVPQLMYHSPDLRMKLKEGLGFGAAAVKVNTGAVNLVEGGTTIDLSRANMKQGTLQAVHVVLEDELCEAMIDSGASVSLLPYSLVQALKWESRMEKSNVKLNFGGRHVEHAKGWIPGVELVFSRKLQVIHNFLVCDHPESPFILGRDFLKGAKVVVEPYNKQLKFEIAKGTDEAEPEYVIIPTHDGTGIHAEVDQEEQERVLQVQVQPVGENISAVCLAEELCLALYQVECVSVKCKTNQFTMAGVASLLEPGVGSSYQGLIVCPTVLHPSRKAQIVVANGLSKDLVLAEGTTIGMVTPMGTSLEEIKTRRGVTEDLDEVMRYMEHCKNMFLLHM